MKVAVVKYNAGNIRSVDYALKRLGVEAVITADEAVLRAADKVIFPGVGEAETTMDFLRAGGMDRLIKELRQPVLGICLGMQVAVIEYARHICGMDDANSTEFDRKTTHPVISLQEEQKSIHPLGATMRLGAYKALIRPGTLAHKLYGKD
ncbi:imidazole glycerol phosphate synthase subunit HisH, partial [Phocaeicola dorei]|uniref:imidazole glycerol phosphate synthase subunit HisH n=1 Tax=Phocaeicola dorei TaxID=357276 RepID=UPI00397B3EB7